MSNRANVQTQAGRGAKEPPRANVSITFNDDGVSGSLKYEAYDSIGVKRTQRHKVSVGSLDQFFSGMYKALKEMVQTESKSGGLFQ